jgi:NTE family protein
MRCPASCVLLFLALLGVAGCSYPIRNEAIVSANRDQYKWTDPGPNSFGDTLVIVTASGGGTRAAALSMAVLKTMDAVRLPSGKSLADEIDVLSSVSGGSVTAGYFALTGAAGLPTLEKNFIRKDGMTPLLVRGLNPVGLAVLSTPSTERIDLFIDYIDQQLFKDATFKALIGRRPYLILNAADMVEGVPFPFTQYTMDLLCSDLTPMKLSTAVAASAAFPVALSPVTLKNYQPCKIKSPPGWLKQAARTSWYLDPPRVALGRTAQAYASGEKKYIHLLDGGIADNLGVNEPFRLLTSDDVAPLFKDDIAKGRIRKIVFVMVNARSAKPSELDSQQATPGMIDMLTASIGASIDRASFSTAERLRTLLLTDFRGIANDADAAGFKDIAANFRTVAGNTKFIAVDFDAIANPTCRESFHSIATSWSLSGQEIDALKAMGEALLAQHHDFPAMLQMVNGRPERTFSTIDAACALLPSPGG